VLGRNKKQEPALDSPGDEELARLYGYEPIYGFTFAEEKDDKDEELAFASTEEDFDGSTLILVDENSNSAADSDEFEATLASEDALQPAKPGNITLINGNVALDITDIAECMFNGTKLFHQLAQSDIDAVDICKSYAFDPSQVNWHVAGTYEWMLNYTLANQDREYFKKNGLISTIAFDYLGINNYKCAIGTSHLCMVDCPTVVKSIEDLETARNVFFALTSATHMLTITEIVHVRLPPYSSPYA